MALHILPANDTGHVPAYDCPCSPSREAVSYEGVLRWAVVHRGLNVTLAEP